MPQTATAPTTSEQQVDLAAAAVLRQLAPPYAGSADGIVRSQLFPPAAPPDTWMAWRADRAGAIVAQLGSRATTTRRRASITVGYQFVQELQRPGNYFWSAALRTVSTSRLPPDRTFTYGFMTLSTQPFLYTQPLVPGRTHVFTLGQYQHPAGRVTLRCGVIVSVDFGPGQSAYVEAIASLQSLVLQSPPLFGAEGETPAAALAQGAPVPSIEAMEPEVRVLEGEGDDDLVAGFDGLG